MPNRTVAQVLIPSSSGQGSKFCRGVLGDALRVLIPSSSGQGSKAERGWDNLGWYVLIPSSSGQGSKASGHGELPHRRS